LERHDSITVKVLDEFLEPFETVWHRYRDPNPTGSINVKSLVEELHKQSLAASGEQIQYG
jgi:hypothetical protein